MLIFNHYSKKAALGFPAGGWALGSEARCVSVCLCTRTSAHLCLEDTGAQERGGFVGTFPFAPWQVLPRSAERTWAVQP